MRWRPCPSQRTWRRGRGSARFSAREGVVLGQLGALEGQDKGRGALLKALRIFKVIFKAHSGGLGDRASALEAEILF